MSDTVHVWLIRQDLPPPLLAELAAVLDGGERARAERAAWAGAEHGRRFAVSHGAARVILGQHLRIAARQVRWQSGPNGKPELAGPGAGVQVSLSHSGDLAALAILDGRRVGIDVQMFPRRDHAIRVAERFYPAAEARFVADVGPAAQVSRFTQLWARKEACVKVTGGRLLQGLRLPAGAAGRGVVHDPGGPLPGPYLVHDVPGPRRYSIAVAAEGAVPYRVLRHWWPGTGGGEPGRSRGGGLRLAGPAGAAVRQEVVCKAATGWVEQRAAGLTHAHGEDRMTEKGMAEASQAALQNANDRRILEAAGKNRKLAAAALLRLGADCPPDLEEVATEVILHSQYPWPEIGRRLGLTRHQAMSRFRRLLDTAGVQALPAPGFTSAQIGS